MDPTQVHQVDDILDSYLDRLAQLQAIRNTEGLSSVWLDRRRVLETSSRQAFVLQSEIAIIHSANRCNCGRCNN